MTVALSPLEAGAARPAGDAVEAVLLNCRALVVEEADVAQLDNSTDRCYVQYRLVC